MLTYQFRLKDSSASWLQKKARATNFVWNYCNETSINAWKSQSKFLSAFDLIKLTTGASKELGLHSQTVNAVCEEYARRAFNILKYLTSSMVSCSKFPPVNQFFFQCCKKTFCHAVIITISAAAHTLM